MPIVSISRIQHRYGLNENLPQLAAAELGWVIDKRRLFIGNGPTSEGAPEIGNTEVLTEYSDILNLAGRYTYKGEAAGYTVQTGPNNNDPVSRTLQEKFDDFASVKDFGATGDGETDDTDAINRALYELFCRDNNVQVRRSLFFPAGIYKISDVIKIPSYAKVWGEGADCAIIRQTSESAACVARTADSLQQVGANIGNNGAAYPTNIDIVDITFENQISADVFLVNATTYSRFHRVGFIGSITAPGTAGSNIAGVTIFSSATNKSSNLVFDHCEFMHLNFGMVGDDDALGIKVNACRFDDLFKGVKLGEFTTGSGSSQYGPKGFNITNCHFDNIYHAGIHAYLVNDIVSSFNYFADVGNHYTGLPAENVIIFADDGCSSIMDTFTRTDLENESVARIDQGGKKGIYIRSHDGIFNGRRRTRPAVQITLLDNTVSATSTGVTLDASIESAAKIYYTAQRGSNIRHGILSITASSSGSTLSDDYQEDGADIGLTFDLNVSGGTTTLRYATTNTGNDVAFTYGIEQINY